MKRMSWTTLILLVIGLFCLQAALVPMVGRGSAILFSLSAYFMVAAVCNQLGDTMEDDDAND